MPGMGGRFSTIMKAKISKLLDRAEDPAETLDYSYTKQLELLQNVKKGIADVVTSKKRLQMQEEQIKQQVVKLDTQARQALAQNREDLARAALERKTVAQTELQTLDQQIGGGLMFLTDLIVMFGSLAFFFWRAAADNDRAEQAAVAAAIESRPRVPA